MKLPTAREMKHIDSTAIHSFAIPGIVLMENAGLGTVLMTERILGSCAGCYAPIFIGPGNNGGDGLVIGRHLHQRGCQPVFFFLVPPDKLQGDAATNLAIVHNLKLPYHVIDTPARVETVSVLLEQFEARAIPCYGIFDAIFGIGLVRNVTDHFADTINRINSSDFFHQIPVISVDIPSGLDSDTGQVMGCCIKADFTATYGCAKAGHFIHGSSSWTGKLEIIDIGIPPEVVHNAFISTELVTTENATLLLQPLSRQPDSHKGSHGHLLLLAGSTGKTGAAILAAKGALRTGVGLASLCVPHRLNPIFEGALVEAMTVPLPNSSDFLSIDDLEMIKDCMDEKQAIILGPGIGISAKTAELVLWIYENASCPVILDADALNILAQNRDTLAPAAGPRVFTPHPGEMSRLLDKPITAIQKNRLDAVLLGCKLFLNPNHKSIFILKGAGTIIAESEGCKYINITGNPGMATGGMGDVLAGIIGGLICQGLTPKDAAVSGVYLHGLAGDTLLEQTGVGFTATELADTLPGLLKKYLANRIAS